jgi:hypothetical protein
MVMPIDAVTRENWERMEKGLKPLPEEKIVKLEPELPEVPNLLEFGKLQVDKVKRIVTAMPAERIRNKEGMIFLYNRISLEMADSKILEGYISSGDFNRLKKLPWIGQSTDARILGVN